jgi:DNA-binding FadR family transcriptional regulator
MTLLAPTRSSTLSTQVARQLEQLITSGEWPVGTRIPAESELVISLGLSRNTIREAIRSLVHMGMLEARVGDGTYVRALSELEAPLMRRAHRARLPEAVELRSLLEQGAAALAAERRSDEDAQRLRSMAVELRRASKAADRDAYAAADDALHRAVVRSAGNALLAEIYEHLGGALKLSVTPELWDRALAEQELDAHDALVDAIASRDVKAAQAAATRLVRELREALLPESRGGADS